MLKRKPFTMMLVLLLTAPLLCFAARGQDDGNDGRVPVKKAGNTTTAIKKGWAFHVTSNAGLKGSLVLESGQEVPIKFFQKVVFEESVEKAGPIGIATSLRTFQAAERYSLDLESGEMNKENLVNPGTRLRLKSDASGSSLEDARSGEEIWDEDMVDVLARPIASPLWPRGKLEKGQRWSYKGRELARRLALIDAKGGRVDLEVKRIYREPSTGLETAQIEGRLKTRLDMDPVPLDFDAKVRIDLPLAVGVPFMVNPPVPV